MTVDAIPNRPTLEPLDRTVDLARGQAAGQLAFDFGTHECSCSRHVFREFGQGRQPPRANVALMLDKP